MTQQHLLCREFPIHNAGVFVEESNKSLLHVYDTITADTFEQDSPIGRGAKIDKLLTEKLNNMSMDERTLGIHELHGVADIPKDEDPKLLETKLQEMNETIRSFIDDTAANSNVDSKTMAYQKAMELDTEYVERIKLLCLKADCYDAQRAATRAVSFFSFKLRLFGHAKLVKNITLDDLNQEDMKTLNNGAFQLLQQRDRAGRGIIMFVGKSASECDTESFFRILYYVHMTAVRDKEIQNKGLVLIFYTIGQTKFHRDRPGRHGSSLLCLPVRVVALHVCCDKKLMDFAAKLLCHSIESKLLCRFRCHYGTYLECMYNLMTFGIPKEVIPIKTESGDLDLTAHHLWIKSVQAREEAARASNMPIAVTQTNEIVVPGKMDVIVGRGMRSRSSVGYLRFRDLIQERRDDYDQALRRSEKTSIANDILQKAKAAGCRFVRWTREGPVECDDLEAREKISHAFRNMRRNTKDGKGEQAVKRNLAEPSGDQFTKESKFRYF